MILAPALLSEIPVNPRAPSRHCTRTLKAPMSRSLSFDGTNDHSLFLLAAHHPYFLSPASVIRLFRATVGFTQIFSLPLDSLLSFPLQFASSIKGSHTTVSTANKSPCHEDKPFNPPATGRERLVQRHQQDSLSSIMASAYPRFSSEIVYTDAHMDFSVHGPPLSLTNLSSFTTILITHGSNVSVFGSLDASAYPSFPSTGPTRHGFNIVSVNSPVPTWTQSSSFTAILSSHDLVDSFSGSLVTCRLGGSKFLDYSTNSQSPWLQPF